MAVDPMEEVAKRMQGLKDSRGPVGMLARGKNMYPAGNNAQSGPGGPDMGRPPDPGLANRAVGPEALQAVMAQTGGAPQPQAPQPMPQSLQGIQQGLQQKFTSPPKVMPQQAYGQIAKAALQAAAQRKLQRGK